MPRAGCSVCPSKIVYNRGLCRACYHRDIYARKGAATCHRNRKEHAGGLCRTCYRAGGRARRALCHPDRLLAARGLCTQCYRNLPGVKKRAQVVRRLKKYGLSNTEFRVLLRKQKHRCAVCRVRRPKSIDHSHSSKTVRGVLCFHCNTGLGHFRDSPALLRAAAAYLERKK